MQMVPGGVQRGLLQSSAYVRHIGTFYIFGIELNRCGETIGHWTSQHGMNWLASQRVLQAF